MKNNKIIIAIDGHSSTGKSTLAKAIAKQLGYTYVDTGAMYRAVTLYAMQNNLIVDNNINIEGLINSLPDINIEFADGNQTYLNGVNVEKEIRSIDVANNVSAVSTIKQVREAMVAKQQQMGNGKGIVMDGRDIGTVVFPQAELKIFMTADPQIRAKRRYDELKSKGQQVELEEIRKNIEDRDRIDTQRETSPLKKADDAIVLDNSYLTHEQQLSWIENKVKEILGNAN